MKIELKSDLKEMTSKAGKAYHSGGIKVGGDWWNIAIFFPDQLKKYEELQPGEVAGIKLYEEEYNGKQYKRFKFLSKTEELAERLDAIEERMNRAGL